MVGKTKSLPRLLPNEEQPAADFFDDFSVSVVG